MNPLAPAPAPLPFSSTIGAPEKPSWLVASSTTASVIAGSAALGAIVIAPVPTEKFAVCSPADRVRVHQELAQAALLQAAGRAAVVVGRYRRAC